MTRTGDSGRGSPVPRSLPPVAGRVPGATAAVESQVGAYRQAGRLGDQAMRFLWPDMLWLLALIPVLLAAYVWTLRRRRRGAVRYASLELVRAALGPAQRIRRHLPPALFLLALAVAILASARPSATLTLPSDYLTLVMAIDVSRSMRAEDVEPTRISAAQAAAREFIEQLPSNIRLGIVSFAGTAAAVQSPTDNKEDLLAAIDRFELQRGTATGSALLVALAMLLPDADIDLEAAVFGSDFARHGGTVSGAAPLPERGAAARSQRAREPVPPGSYTGGAIVLMSDGRRTTGPDPLEAARLAASLGVRVYTVGFGSKGGAPVHVEGWSFFAVPDEETLKAVAGITEGQYFSATTGADLKKVYANLSSKFALERRDTEVSALFSAAAALLLAGAGLLSLLWLHRRA